MRIKWEFVFIVENVPASSLPATILEGFFRKTG